ncbi:hypothetical protein L195_g031075, partial [Trifolium pratense]
DGGMSVDATLSTHAFARREKTAKLREEWGHWQRQVEPQVEEAKVDRDADMDVGDQEEAEGDDGGMSVDATKGMFPGPEPIEFSEGPSNKGHDHHASPIADQHASSIAPLAQGNIPTNGVQKNLITDEQASLLKGQTERHIPEIFYQNFRYLPAEIRAWSGQFQILQGDASGEFYDGFVAQPPCIVSRKAYIFSKKLPSVLQLESLSALNVLKDVYQDYPPTIQDLALYFFPLDNNERSKNNLNSLIKFMDDKNLMLRSFVDEVELMVFTSNKLDENSRGTIAVVYEGDFLWGTFRPNKTDIASKRLSDIDTIDTMGGNDTEVQEEIGQDIALTQDKLIEDLGPRVRRPPKWLINYVQD